MRNLRGRILGVAVLATAALGAPAAQAAYPGGNGDILFERNKSLYTISPAGPVNSESRLAKVGSTTDGPEYSPNGKRIAFAADLGAGSSSR